MAHLLFLSFFYYIRKKPKMQGKRQGRANIFPENFLKNFFIFFKKMLAIHFSL